MTMYDVCGIPQIHQAIMYYVHKAVRVIYSKYFTWNIYKTLSSIGATEFFPSNFKSTHN